MDLLTVEFPLFDLFSVTARKVSCFISGSFGQLMGSEPCNSGFGDSGARGPLFGPLGQCWFGKAFVVSRVSARFLFHLEKAVFFVLVKAPFLIQR